MVSQHSWKWVNLVVRWWWRPYWRQGPLWICKMRYYSTDILSVIYFLYESLHMHLCNACGRNNDQLVLEYHLAPYCILNSAFLNSSTLPVIEYTDNSLHDTDLAINNPLHSNLHMLGMEFCHFLNLLPMHVVVVMGVEQCLLEYHLGATSLL